MTARARYLTGLRRRARRQMWLDRRGDDLAVVLWSAGMAGLLWMGLR